MKKILFTAGIMMSAALYAQDDCSDLFISEYLEGLSNNKALEIYNPTNEDIDLSNYFVVRYDNGNSAPTVSNAVQLRGIVAAKDVHVGVLDKRNPDGEGQEAPIWDDLVAKADEWYCPDYNESKAFYWNGNDAVVLFKGVIPEGTPLAMPITSLKEIQPLDIFGKIGENPGEASQGGGWTYDGTPASQGGAVVSADHFLVRKAHVKKGNDEIPETFKPNIEWDSLSFFVYVYDSLGNPVLNNQGEHARRMNVDNLGIHDCDCNTSSLTSELPQTSFEFTVYPNPVSNKQINLITTEKIKEVVIIDALGNIVQTIPNAKPAMSIDFNKSPGVYFIQVKSSTGLSQTKKFIVQ